MNTLTDIYRTDYSAWALRNAKLLEQGRFSEIDIAHIVEELVEMGASNRNELVNRLRVLLAHLLNWQYQLHQLAEMWEKFQGNSWRATIIEQRVSLQILLEDHPGLKPALEDSIARAYPAAVRLASAETGLLPKTFPETCPYTPRQVLDDHYYPAH